MDYMSNQSLQVLTRWEQSQNKTVSVVVDVYVRQISHSVGLSLTDNDVKSGMRLPAEHFHDLFNPKGFYVRLREQFHQSIDP